MLWNMMDVNKQYTVERYGFFLEDTFIPKDSTLDIISKKKNSSSIMRFTIPEGEVIDFDYDSIIHQDLVELQYITYTENCKEAPIGKFEIGDYVIIEDREHENNIYNGCIYDKKYDFLNEKWKYQVVYLGSADLSWKGYNINDSNDGFIEEKYLTLCNSIAFTLVVDKENTLTIEIEKKSNIDEKTKYR